MSLSQTDAFLTALLAGDLPAARAAVAAGAQPKEFSHQTVRAALSAGTTEIVMALEEWLPTEWVSELLETDFNHPRELIMLALKSQNAAVVEYLIDHYQMPVVPEWLLEAAARHAGLPTFRVLVDAGAIPGDEIDIAAERCDVALWEYIVTEELCPDLDGIVWSLLRGIGREGYPALLAKAVELRPFDFHNCFFAEKVVENAHAEHSKLTLLALAPRLDPTWCNHLFNTAYRKVDGARMKMVLEVLGNKVDFAETLLGNINDELFRLRPAMAREVKSIHQFFETGLPLPPAWGIFSSKTTEELFIDAATSRATRVRFAAKIAAGHYSAEQLGVAATTSAHVELLIKHYPNITELLSHIRKAPHKKMVMDAVIGVQP